MIVVMAPEATEARIAEVVRVLTEAGCRVRRSGTDRAVLGITGSGFEPPADLIEGMPGVADVAPAGTDYRLVSRAFQAHDTLLDLGGGLQVGGERIVLMAGPCSVETPEVMDRIAAGVKEAGGHILRGGAYKPRTSPYAFQGLGEEGLFILREAADRHGLLVISEVTEPSQIPMAAHYCDLLQVGTRNMQNVPLLRELGRARRPVMLKRGMAATIEEWLGAAEYIASCGNSAILLCERGIRTFETATRNTLDLSAVPAVKERSHLPVVVDPSHGTGRRGHVPAMARAAVAAGADALIIEVHSDPEAASSDRDQTITLETLAELAVQLRRIAAALGRTL